MREEVAAIDRDGALDTVLPVEENLGSSCDVVLVHFEQMGAGVQIETGNAGGVAVGCVVVLAEDNADSAFRILASIFPIWKGSWVRLRTWVG